MATTRKRISVISLFVLACVALGCATVASNKLCLKDACINVEIADSDYKRQDGLMFRESLPEEEGMLFVFGEEGLYGFWMLHMRFPLDIIWIGQDKRIVHIQKNAPVCLDPNDCRSMMPQVKARYVLEVNAGFADKHQLKVGDRLKLPAGQ